MAREIYAFDLGEFAAFSSDPRIAHADLTNAITRAHPILEATREIWSFSYAIIGLYADGEKYDYHVYLHVENQRDATLVKTFLP